MCWNDHVSAVSGGVVWRSVNQTTANSSIGPHHHPFSPHLGALIGPRIEPGAGSADLCVWEGTSLTILVGTSYTRMRVWRLCNACTCMSLESVTNNTHPSVRLQCNKVRSHTLPPSAINDGHRHTLLHCYSQHDRTGSNPLRERARVTGIVELGAGGK